MKTFGSDNYRQLCNELSIEDPVFQTILNRHGYPPLWSRKPGFETLIHIILEQQVSLASARAALYKLKEKIRSVTPERMLALNNDELRACYFSRQKMVYARHLSTSVLEGKLVFADLAMLEDEGVRHQLKTIKGIGDWTADVYLMMALHRCDRFPVGDIALVNSVKYELDAQDLGKDDILELSKKWRPNRTVAAFLFWHAYIQRKGMVVPYEAF
ncbi:MAG: DNA-3-methyladenine glycosylase 2 family protein [Chitinophagaceae bacterium]